MTAVCMTSAVEAAKPAKPSPLRPPARVGRASTWKPEISLDLSGRDVALLINRRPALRFDSVNEPWALPDRPQIVVNRLRNLVDRGFNPKSITVKDTPQGAILLAGGSALLTVSDAEAKLKGMTRQSLAATWERTLREMLTQAPVVLTPSRLTIPVGETRTVRIESSPGVKVELLQEPNGVVEASTDEAIRTVTLVGKEVGAGTLRVTLNGYSAETRLIVRKYAGRVQDTFLPITGNGPDRLTLHDLINNQVARNTVAEPGASAKVFDSYQLPRVIPPGGAVVRVPVTLSGPDYIPVERTAQVRLLQEEVGRTEPNFLFYSNDPEMLRKYYGVLYNETLKSQQTARLLYHHQSAMAAPIRFIIQIQNGPTPARLQIIDGSANPQLDTYQIGHRAAAKFIPLWLNDSGYIRQLEPNETFTLLEQRLTKDQTASGIYHLALLSGSGVTIQIRAEPPDQAPAMREAKANPEVYSTTRQRVKETYNVGGRWTFVPFGREPVRNNDKTHPLHGNYGVIYDMTFNLENPTGQRNVAELVFDPAAGVARGVFLVDGRMMETTHIQPPQEYVLGTYPLGPGEKKQVHVLTMPLAGSNYPATFVVRPRNTLARQPLSSATGLDGAGK